QRVEGRIELYAPAHGFGVGGSDPLQPLDQPVTDVQPFELVAVHARHHRHLRAGPAVDHRPPQLESLAIRELQAQNGVVLDVHRFTSTSTSKLCEPPPKITPLSGVTSA